MPLQTDLSTCLVMKWLPCAFVCAKVNEHKQVKTRSKQSVKLHLLNLRRQSGLSN